MAQNRALNDFRANFPEDSSAYNPQWTVLQKFKGLEKWLATYNIDVTTLHFDLKETETKGVYDISIIGQNFLGHEITLPSFQMELPSAAVDVGIDKIYLEQIS